jgi:hypothetical protein
VRIEQGLKVDEKPSKDVKPEDENPDRKIEFDTALAKRTTIAIRDYDDMNCVQEISAGHLTQPSWT